MFKTKYVRTKNDEIICFPETISHLEFSEFNPISAGFIIICSDPLIGHPICKCLVNQFL